MTDRQTDTKARGAWWIITAYNSDILKCEQSSAYPTWVKAVHGGREECPTTKREHFQGAVNTQSVRWSQVKSWLSESHIELATSPEAARKYCMKQETALGSKVVRDNDIKFYRMDQLLTLLGYYELKQKANGQFQDKFKGYADMVIDKKLTVNEWSKEEYWYLVQCVLQEKGSYLISSFSKGDMYSAWCNLRSHWLTEALSITEPPDPENKISGKSINDGEEDESEVPQP